MNDTFSCLKSSVTQFQWLKLKASHMMHTSQQNPTASLEDAPESAAWSWIRLSSFSRSKFVFMNVWEEIHQQFYLARKLSLRGKVFGPDLANFQVLHYHHLYWYPYIGSIPNHSFNGNSDSKTINISPTNFRLERINKVLVLLVMLPHK